MLYYIYIFTYAIIMQKDVRETYLNIDVLYYIVTRILYYGRELVF